MFIRGLCWLIAFVLFPAVAFAIEAPDWKNGDFECPKLDWTNRYIDVPLFHDLESMARVDRIPGLNVFKDLQAQHLGKKIRLYYEIFRPFDRAKKLLILIPGGPGQTHADMHALEPLLGEEIFKHFNVIVMDHRGLGCSRPLFPGHEPPQSLMMRQAASDIEMIRRELVGDRGKINVWGYSYGSILAQTYALLYPDHIERLWLGGAVSSADEFNLAGLQLESLITSAMEPKLKDELLHHLQGDPELKNNFFMWSMYPLYEYVGRTKRIPEKAQEILLKLNDGRRDEVLKNLSYSQLDVMPWMTRSLDCLEIFSGRAKYEGEFSWVEMGFSAACKEYEGHQELFNYTPLLRQIEVPTFIWGGAFDHVTPARAMFRMANEIPNNFLYIDNFLGHGISGKGECLKQMTLKFFMGADAQELHELSYRPICQDAPNVR